MASKPSSNIPDGVTKAQRAMLETLDTLGWWDAPHLLTMLYDHHRTTQGVTMTAASLVRRGLVEKRRNPPNGIVYHITHDGAQLLAALRYTEQAKR